MVQKYSEKAISPKIRKKGRNENKKGRVAIGAHAYRITKNDRTKGRGFALLLQCSRVQYNTVQYSTIVFYRQLLLLRKHLNAAKSPE